MDGTVTHWANGTHEERKQEHHLVTEMESCHDGPTCILPEAQISVCVCVCVSPAALIKGKMREWICLLGLSGLRVDGLKNHEINN